MLKTKLGKSYIHSVMAILVYVLLTLVLPTDGLLTVAGARTIAVFFSLTYLWITVGNSWPSLLCYAMFVMVSPLTLNQLLTKSFGASTTALLIVFSMLNFTLQESGFVQRLVNWFITRNICRNRPWVFVTMFLLSAWVVSCFVTCSTLSMLMLPLLAGIVEELKLDKDSKFAKCLYWGVMIIAPVGYIATPIAHSTSILTIGLIESTLGVSISFAQWMVIGIPASLVVVALYILFMRVYIRPDTAAFVNYDIDGRRAAIPPMLKRERRTLIVFLAAIFCIVTPDLINFVLPSVAAVMKKMGAVSFAVIGITAMCLITADGAPLMDFKHAVSKVPLTTVFMSAGLQLCIGAMGAEGTGINEWLAEVVSPLTEQLSSGVMVIIGAAIMVTLLSNVLNATIGLNLTFSTMVPVALALATAAPGMVNPVAVGVIVGMLGNLAICHPTASGSCPFFLGGAEGILTPADGPKLGWVAMPIGIIVALLVISPLTGIIVG